MNGLDFWDEQEKAEAERDAQDYEIQCAYQQGKESAFNEFLIKCEEFQNIPCGAKCNGNGGECVDCFVVWFKEQTNESNNSIK